MIAKIEPAFSSMSTLIISWRRFLLVKQKNYSTLRVILYLLFLIICFFSLRLMTG